VQSPYQEPVLVADDRLVDHTSQGSPIQRTNLLTER
ncbi:MAG: hypothetical protein QOD83_4614, partial [Solirubrobacteraceae bacterium]|nr:hypothetical protein [Solirubrobacteraceae bacterium]